MGSQKMCRNDEDRLVNLGVLQRQIVQIVWANAPVGVFINQSTAIMPNLSYRSVLFGCLLLMFLLPLAVQANDVVVGVNLVNRPDQLTPQEQDAILGNMQAVGVRVIRAGIDNGEKNTETYTEPRCIWPEAKGGT
jgi:hypothetical protein